MLNWLMCSIVFDFIERFYNLKRRHSTIRDLSQFEMQARYV